MPKAKKLNFIQRAAFSIVKGQVDEYVEKFLAGEDLPKEVGEKSMDSDTAMKYSAVFACNRVLNETLAAMPIMEYKKLENGDRIHTNQTAAFDVLHYKPNDEMAPFNFKEACMYAVNLGGNSVSQRIVSKSGDLLALIPQNWEDVQITRDRETHKLVYTIRANGQQIPLSRSEVFHIPGPSLDGVIGMSPIEYVASAIRLGTSYERFGLNFYKNGANSSGGFSVPGELSEESYNRLQKDLKNNYTGLKNTGRPMLLEGGMTFVPFTINPADAQLIDMKRFQTEDICRIYRVPLHLVQDLQRSTNNNIEQQSLEFIMYTMLPHFKRWEENANAQLLTPKERKDGYYLEFKIDSLLRGDAVARATAYAQGRNWGWLSVNDIRKLENMPSIPNGDIYLQPSNTLEAGTTAQQLNDQVKAMAEEIYKILDSKSK